MSAKARLNKFRNQLRLRGIQQYKQSIRGRLADSHQQISLHPIMDIQSINLDSSKSNSIIKSAVNLLFCETNNKNMSDFEHLTSSSAEIKSIAKRFQTQIDKMQFSGQSIEEFCKLVYFVCYCVQSGRSKFQKLKCIQIMYSILPKMLEEIIQLCTYLVVPANTSFLELVSLVNLLIGKLEVKLQRRQNDEVDFELLSFLVLQKIYFMKETRLLTHNQTINNTFYLLQRVIDCIFVAEFGTKQTILNNSLKTMNLITNADILWQNQKFQEMFCCFIEHSFDLLQEQIVTQIWNQNFIQILKLIYEKPNILFSSNFNSTKRIVFELILKAIQLQEVLPENKSQLTSYFILKMMFQYSYYTETVSPRWIRYCKKVIERGFDEQKAGLQECLALIILYQVQQGKAQLQLLLRQMQQRQFVQLYQHLTYYNSQVQMSKWDIASSIFNKLVGPL